MTQTEQNILGIIVLVGVFILSRYGVGWRMKKAARLVIAELKQAQAESPETAIALDWAKPNWLKFGLRDFRPKVLADLVTAGHVGVTENGTYFLRKDTAQLSRQDSDS